MDSNCLNRLHNTVEPPNKGHFGNGHFVLFSEAVPISEACHCLTIKHLSMMLNDTRNDINIHINVQLVIIKQNIT